MGLLQNFLNTEEKNPYFWYRKGKELCSRGYYLDACEALDRMLAIEPSHADSWFLKGYGLYQIGRYEESLQFFDQALSINPGLYEALTYKGLICSNFGRHSEAIEFYNRALDVNPSCTKAFYVKGLTLAIGERFDEAIQCYEQALAIEPDHIDALAGISMAMKKRDKAKGLRRVPHRINQEAAVLSFQTRQVGPEVSSTKEIPLHAPSGSARAMEKQHFIPAVVKGNEIAGGTKQKPAAAMAREKKVERTCGDSGGISNGLLTGTILGKDHETIVAANPKFLRAVPPPGPPGNAYEEKIRFHHESLVKNPEDPDGWITIGNLSIKTGKYQQAADAYERALGLDETDTQTWISLGDARKKLGNYDEAEAAYDRALKLSPGRGIVWINKAKTLAMLGRHEDAIIACREAVRLNDTDIDALLYLGFLLKKMSRHSDAIHTYDRVLAIDPYQEQAIRQRRILSDGE